MKMWETINTTAAFTISNLVWGIFVLLQPVMCGLNELQGFPGHDGNTVGSEREDSVEEVSLSRCEHLKNIRFSQ